ncbi:DUF1804 family protein [Thiothrix nivea]|uniref:Uncharacterized protein n=1 Tax=Thiothrix nivea (strain ATCC 35100 / DSM 5205 / JP2) TaxID=870187 RepID=A0A656HAT3_THINJ|nr:DUF1804 family protein [Thiothrix nivea]EIJ33353.1 protein of unknown function DUF1804 [Thiothrix nivea DSM 5205]
MAYPQETRLKGRNAYVRGRMSMPDAAVHAGVSEATLKLWKARDKEQGDDWDQARAAARLAMGGLGDMTAEVLEDFILQFKRAMQDLNNDTSIPAIDRAEVLAKLSDSYIKTMKAATSSNSNLARLSVALEVLEVLSKFIQGRFPHHVPILVEILDTFGPELSKHYGA